MTDREQLARQIEAADAGEQRAMLEAAFVCIHKMYDGLAPADWSALNWPFADRFTAMLDAEAYESAAMMLVPEELSALEVEAALCLAIMRCAKLGGNLRKDLARYLAAAAVRAGGE